MARCQPRPLEMIERHSKSRYNSALSERLLTVPDLRPRLTAGPFLCLEDAVPTALLGDMAELERLAYLEQQAEEAYDAMYEAHSPSHAAACYSDAKEALYCAITIAQQLRAEDAVKRL